jgi:saccharopine dehydrogenase-like NADP-dependent oxidoreductase
VDKGQRQPKKKNQLPKKKGKKADAAVEVDQSQKEVKFLIAVAEVVEVVNAITLIVNMEVVEEVAKEEVSVITETENHASRTRTNGSTSSTRIVYARPTITRSKSLLIWKFQICPTKNLA